MYGWPVTKPHAANLKSNRNPTYPANDGANVHK
jgi:hypothetical protein